MSAYNLPAVDEASEAVSVQMMRLFSASRQAHATYNPDSSTHTRRADGKLHVRYQTVRRPVTLDLWRRHLAGRYPLVLSLACDNGTSAASVVDVDQYDLNNFALVSAIKREQLPFFVRPSKSGGAHVYAFHDAPIPVLKATAVAEGMARRLRLTRAEHFPKPQNPDLNVLPQPLNMPYFGGEGGFIHPGSKGGHMLVDEFLRSIVRLSAEQRAELDAGTRKTVTAQSKGDHGEDRVLASMMEADSGMGVSTRPEDNAPVYPPMSAEDLELKLRVALSVIPSDEYDLWYRIGAAIFSGLGDVGYSLFDEWSRESAKYDSRACERKWNECRKIRSIKVQTIFWYADRHDRGWRKLYQRLLVGEVAA